MKVTDNVMTMRDGLTATLGITYHPTEDPDTIEGRMTCTPATAQPWGYLSGGATVALAENLAGVGSMCLCPDRVILGINVSANHLTAVRLGETVIATARLIHKGGTLHDWFVEVKSESGEMVSTIQVTNYTIKNGK